MPLNVDVTAASLTILGNLPELLSQRDALKRLPDFDLEELDRLEDLARATRHAQTLLELSGQPRRSHSPMLSRRTLPT